MKRAIAVSVGGVLVAAGLALPGVAQAAVAPSEVRVLPAPTIDSYIGDEQLFAGATGFLHRQGAPWVWTSYADRRSTVVEALNGLTSSTITNGGGDTVVLGDSVPGHPVTDTTRPALDLATMTWRDVPMGASNNLFRLMGDSVLAIKQGPPYEMELRKLAADGSSTPVPITGLPADTTSVTIADSDGRGALLRIGGNGPRYGLLDAGSGKVGVLPTTTAANWYKLSDEAVGLFTLQTAEILNRDEVLDGTATAPEPLEVSTINSGHVGLAGEDLILSRTTGTDKLPVVRYADGSTTPAEVVPQGSNLLLQGQDGVLLIGGTGTADWSVRKATAAGQSVVLPLTAMDSAGITLSSGVVRHTTALIRPTVAPLFRQYATQIGVGAPGTGSLVADGPLVEPVLCQTGVVCVRTVDGANNGSAYLSAGSPPQLRNVPLGSVLPEVGPNARLVDASPNFRLVSYPNAQDVFRTNGTKLGFEGAPASALWFNTLYRAGNTGLVELWNASTGTQGIQPVSTGSACAKTDLQATGKHLYWACAAEGTAGVVELATRKLIAVPAGQFLLGDNYLVRHDADGDLLRYDLTGGTLGEPVKMAGFPRGDLTDDRNITWAVDKFGGDVAWVDAGNAVHIVDPGVTPSAPAAGLSSAPTELALPGTFTATAQLTRPVDSTTLTITQVRTRKTVKVTGGAARVTATVAWDGGFEGDRAAKGPYQWTLAGTADGVTANLGTGRFTVGCGGKPMLHSYECTSQPSLLALTSATTGAGNWQFTRDTNDTITMASGGSESLGALNGIVPFGDINRDYKNDLLVRRADGTMRAYLGGENPPFGSASSVALPGNWNVYDALLHTGDLTGDGLADLVTRDRESGSLYIFPGNGTGGFAAARKINGGYKGYSRFVGTGDINGDGKADLMMQYDPTSTMYAMYSKGDGTFQDRVVISTGWLGYNAVIGAGDLNEDGLNDLLLRDTAGVLYRRLGAGIGTFGDRAVVGSGYQQYAGVY